jgi:hypothetical protein
MTVSRATHIRKRRCSSTGPSAIFAHRRFNAVGTTSSRIVSLEHARKSGFLSWYQRGVAMFMGL